VSADWRVLLVDDEPPALKRMAVLVSRVPGFSVVATCAHGGEAVAATLETQPDVVLLDIQMPGITGIDVVREVGADMPLVIFVTAHDEFALDAYRLRAFDYLVKPVDADQLRDSLERAGSRLRADRLCRHLALPGVVFGEAVTPPRRTRVPIRHDDGRVRFVDLAEIERVEVDGTHLSLHTPKGAHRIRMSLGEFEARIPPRILMRVHRSAMVNLEQIQEIQPWFHGDFVILMRSGARVVSGRTYREQVRALTELR
jgi:two-component system LytT family response regulator